MKTKMRKSASACQFKIQFNPDEAKVGKSSIDKLPIRRKTSTSSLLNDKKTSKNQNETEQYQITLLKRVNESLERQNQRLKKELQYYIQQGISSRRSSFVGNQQDYKDKLASRIDNRSKISMKVDHQSTGLSTTKHSKCIQDTITQLYEKYTNKKCIPSLENVYEVAKEYFYEFKENYVKFKIIADNASGEESRIRRKVQELLYLFKVPILFRQNVSTLVKSLSKDKKQDKGKEPQLNSPSETLVTFDQMLKIISKSSKMLEKVKNSPYYIAFQKKIKYI